MEIVRERLEREFDLDLLITAPNVAYRATRRDGALVEVHNPAEMPRELEQVEEPYVKASVIVPKEYVGTIMELANERRGTFDHLEYLSEDRVLLVYLLPLGEIVLDFYDQLKSRTRGYASFDYELAGFRPGDLTRVDILVGGEPVDALSLIVHRDAAYDRGRQLVDRLREEIPRQMFDVPVQAAIGSRVIARETIKAKRKDVLAKCYGGDITRKRKLLEKQKKGKKRMKQVGGVEVPQEAFLAVLNLDSERRKGPRSGISTSISRSAHTAAATATSSRSPAGRTLTTATSTRSSPSSSSSGAFSRSAWRPCSSAAEHRRSPVRRRSPACSTRSHGRSR
jgi:GTP-binding protein LepA